MNRQGRKPGELPRRCRIVRKDNQIEIPSTLDCLPKVDSFIEGKLRKLGIKKDHLVDIAISVSEIVTNAVVHGNKNDLGKKVRINLHASSSRVEVIVQDEGVGFDPHCVECPIDQDNLLKEAGRGMLIVESLMDKVEILSGPEEGTRVKIIKLLN